MFTHWTNLIYVRTFELSLKFVSYFQPDKHSYLADMFQRKPLEKDHVKPPNDNNSNNSNNNDKINDDKKKKKTTITRITILLDISKVTAELKIPILLYCIMIYFGCNYLLGPLGYINL